MKKITFLKNIINFFNKIGKYIIQIIRIITDNVYYCVKKSKDEFDNYDNFSIMTFNLRRDAVEDGENNWQKRKSACVDMIKKQKPCVLCMQEVMPHMFKYMIYRLKNKYGYYGIDSFSGLKLNKTPLIFFEGNAIMYDKDKYLCFDKGFFWLSDNYDKPSRVWDALNFRTCVYVGLCDKNTEDRFYVFASHFDHKSLTKNQALLVINKIKQITNGEKSFFCGDLNIPFNNPALDPLNKIYTNSTGENGIKTYHAFCEPYKIIDMIYYNDEYENCVDTDSYGVNFISDHYPVLIYKTCK